MTALSHDHNPFECHKANNERQQVIKKLKELVVCLDECDNAAKNAGGPSRANPEWTRPLIVYPQTKERKACFDKSDRIPPWEKKRKSIQIMGGTVVKGCSCTKRDGLQADCQMSECKGHPLCLIKPYPMCPPSGRAQMPVTPDEAEKLLQQLGPATKEPAPGQCSPGESCRPGCIPCTATVRDLCRWIPGWMEGGEEGKSCGGNEAQGASGGGKACQQEIPQQSAKNVGGRYWCCVVKDA